MNSEKKKRKGPLAQVGRGTATLAVLAAILFSVLGAGCSEDLTPEQVARNWVNDNVDLGGELLAEWILGAGPVEPSSAGGWLAKEVGGELIEDKMHEVIKWDYSSARGVGDGWEVTATASVSFPEYAGFEAGLPLILSIDGQVVSEWRPDYMSAYAKADIPDISGVAEAALNISEAFDSGDCIGAARAAGVPDSVIEYLKKPASERNFVEKAAIETAIGTVNLPDGCAESLVGQ